MIKMMMNIRFMGYCVLLSLVFVAPSLFGLIKLYNNTIYKTNYEVVFRCSAEVINEGLTECKKVGSVNPYHGVTIPSPIVKTRGGTGSGRQGSTTVRTVVGIKATVPAQEVLVSGRKVQRAEKWAHINTTPEETATYMINANRPKNNDLSVPVEGLALYRFIGD